MPVGYRPGNGYAYVTINPYPAIILILIVLQWFRVWKKDEEEEECNSNNLLSNGGLFIITLFLLVYCSCSSELANAIRYSQLYARPRRGLFGRGFLGRLLWGRRFY
jgi:hypothetical protein